MNHKQKFGYTLLGVVIMLIGIGVGAIVSPPLVAQRDAVFGKIECAELEIVNKNGKPAFLLGPYKEHNRLAVYNQAGKLGFSLMSGKTSNSFSVFDRKQDLAIALGSAEIGRFC